MSRRSPTVDDCCNRLAQPYRHPTAGVVVAISGLGVDVVRSFGRIDAARAEAPTLGTLFEIGSITKVFTSVLLSRFVADGRVGLDTPVAELVAGLSGVPAWITPRTLATHTSGLPRVPFGWWQLLRMDATDPYAAFDSDALLAWMSGYRPSRPPAGQGPRYSNLGVGLLGYVLARIGGRTYADVLRGEVLEPLHLTDTVVELDVDRRARFAMPHHGRGKATPPWTFDALAGAGALRSTAQDLLAFGRATLAAHRGADPLGGAIARTLEVQVPKDRRTPFDQCLAWTRRRTPARSLSYFFHDGGTLGSSSALFVIPDPGLVVVVLANYGLGLWRMLAVERSRPSAVCDDLVDALTAGGTPA